MIRLGERDRMVVDRSHFERLVARAILFRRSEQIVQRQDFGGYRANIVTYTLALLCHATSQRIDLRRIWQEQGLTENLQRVIGELSHEVHGILTNPPTAGNITEWCKSEKCWESVRAASTAVPVGDIRDGLLDTKGRRNEQRRAISGLPSDYVENIKRLVRVPSEGWGLLARWGAETGSIDPGQRQVAIRIAKALQRRGQKIRPSDAEKAVEILDRAATLGFTVEPDGMQSQSN